MDLSDIKLIKGQERDRRHYSFVGIERNKQNGQLEFWLPLGFEEFPEDDFTALKTFFFKMYRTLSVYFKRRADRPLEEGEERDTDRDGFYQSDKGFSFRNEDQEEIVLFSKINALDKIIEGYDDLRIAALERKVVRTEEIDYSKIHRYLHQAVYLEDDVIYLDEMRIPRGIITASSPPLVQMFCFIYAEIKREIMETDSVPDRANELAEQFKDHFLQPDTQLFGSPEMLNQSVAIMKEVLEDIETDTVYKDEDFWHFFEAVEAFLYAERNENEEGIYWGISNFYDVWEDMCRVFSLEYFDRRILFIDQGELEDKSSLPVNPFRLTFNDDGKFRMLRPDLVLNSDTVIVSKEEDIFVFHSLKKKLDSRYQEVFGVSFLDFPLGKELYPHLIQLYFDLANEEENYKTGGTFRFLTKSNFLKLREKTQDYIREQNQKPSNLNIVDFKYMAQMSYQDYSPQAIDQNGENKIRADIQKQLIYEWTTQQNIEGCRTKSEFWIPYYNPTRDQPFEESRSVCRIENDAFKQSQIQVVKIDFTLMQDIYLAHGLQQSLR